MPSKTKPKPATSTKKAAAPPASEPPAPAPDAATAALREKIVAADAEIALAWKEAAKLKKRVAAQRKHLIGLASVAFRLDAFIDAIRPTLPSEAGDEADALKAAISELRS